MKSSIILILSALTAAACSSSKPSGSAATPSSPMTASDHQVGNGGNQIGLEFESAATQAIEEFSASHLMTATPARITQLENALRSTKVVAVEGKLLLDASGTLQNCAAVNEPRAKTIFVSGKWNDIKDTRVRRALALHELEGIIGEEATGNYLVSGQYLAFTGFGASPQVAFDSTVSSVPTNRRNGKVDEYICYDDVSHQTGIDLSVGHSTLTVYIVGLKAQKGGMFSDGDGRESILLFDNQSTFSNGAFNLSGGSVIHDSSGQYSDAFDFTLMRFYPSGTSSYIDFVDFTTSRGLRKSYKDCELKSSRD